MITEQEQKNAGGMPPSEYEQNLVESLQAALAIGLDAAKKVKQLYIFRPNTTEFQEQCRVSAQQTIPELQRLIERLDRANFKHK